MHRFFLTADPDIFFDTSRGPLTDEGWHHFQLRNFINSHGFDIATTDSFLKSPLFNLLLYPVFLLIGQQLSYGRMLVVLLSILPFLCLLKISKPLALLLGALVLLHPLVFQYSHYLMPEMLCITSIALAIFCFMLHLEKGTCKPLVGAVMLLFVAFLLKAQYIYILILPFCYALFFFFTNQLPAEKIKVLVTTVILTSILLLAYFFGWYKPHYPLIQYYFSLLSSGQYATVNETWERMCYYYNDWLAYQPFWKSYVTIFWCSVCIGIYLLVFQPSKKFQVVFLLSACWVLLEIHKFFAIYIPVRYVLPMVFAGMLVIVIVLWELMNYAQRSLHLPLKIIAYGLFLGLSSVIVLKNFKWNLYLYQHRNYSMAAAKNYILAHIPSQHKVLGNWAASLCFGLPNEVRAITYGVADWHDLLRNYGADVVITETNQEDSDRVFDRMQINLVQQSDSVINLCVANRSLQVFWLKEKLKLKDEKK